MAIQHWSKKIDASNNITWNKETLSSSNANNILVTNPTVTSTPDVLDNVLGKMKKNINELYGNVKWLALHGGKGNGSFDADDAPYDGKIYGRKDGEWTEVKGGSGGGSDTPVSKEPYLTLVEVSSRGERKLEDGGTLSVSSDEFTLGIYLYNGEKNVDYLVSVSGNGRVYLSNKVLTNTNNYVEVKISGIESVENLRLVCNLKDTENNSYPSKYLNVNYANVQISAKLIQNNSEILPGTSSISKDIMSDYEVMFDFNTSIIGGTISYTISAPALLDDDKKSFVKSGNVENGAEVYVNFSDGYDFQVSRSYEIKVTAKVNTLISGQIVTLASSSFVFNAQKLNEDDLFVTFSDKRWKLVDNSFDENCFENGQDAILDSVLVGNKEYFTNIYYIVKFFYEKNSGALSADGNHISEWVEIPLNVLQGYGYFSDGIDETQDFLTPESEEDFKTVVTNDDKKNWIRKYSREINSWCNENTLRNFSITSDYGTQSNVTISYAIISSLGDVFNFEESEVVDEETSEVSIVERLVSNGRGSIAHIKAELYAFNLNYDDAEHLILPISYNPDTDTVEYVPTVTVKTRIRKSSISVPDYVKGVQHGIVKSDGTEYVETDSRYFSFDSIGVGKSTVQSTLNTLTDAKYTSVQGSNAIQMKMFNCNGDSDGNGNSGIVDVVKQTMVNNKVLKYKGENVSNVYKCFRASGDSYAKIEYDSTFKKAFNFSSASVKENGFTIELCFQSDTHPHSNGTIFSMGSYTADGTLVTGINVDLEKATFTISENVENKKTSTSIPLIQGEFTQLDFVYEYSKVGGSANSTEYGIIKIYQNGICTGIANLVFPARSSFIFSGLENGITLGCKAIQSGGKFGTNFTDVNFYGVRFYKEKLTDCEIIKNWLISNSMANLGWEENDKGTYDSVIDYVNVVAPQLKKNYFSDDWISVIWNYGNGQKSKTGVATGQELFNKLSAWIQPEKGDGYRVLPIVYLHNEDEICNLTSDIFYNVYNETEASKNNKYIDNAQFDNCFKGYFDYYDTTLEKVISSKSAMSGRNVAWMMQGTSTQGYRSKNIEICFNLDENDKTATGDLGQTVEGVGYIDGGGKFLFTPKPSEWLPENRFTLKADMVDSAHANNAAIGRWINSSGYMPKNPVQQDLQYEYNDFIKPTLEGFPVLVFINWGTKYNNDGTPNESYQVKNGIQFLGIYSFNLGRGSYYNLGFKRFKKYELQGNSNKSITDEDYNNWSDPRACKQASFVKRYIVEPDSDKVFSFECNSNEPVGAVSFEQPNKELIKSLWDIKYKASSANSEIGYNRLHKIVKTISYFNNDSLNYFEKSSIPEYYYSCGDLTADGNIGRVPVFREKDNFANYVVGNNVPVGSEVVEETANGKIYRFPDGKMYYSDYLRWYEGLRDYEDEDFSCGGRNTTKNSKGQYEIYDANGEFLRFYHVGSLMTNPLNPDYFPDRTGQTEEIQMQLGYYAHLYDGEYSQNVDKTPKSDEINYLSQMIHYASFSRYFDIAMIFGMVDSLGKNFTLRSWNITDTDKGTILPAFYDMDTALGLDNAGAENVDPTVYMDYWLTQNTNNGNNGMSSLHIFTEDVPYLESDENNYYFYDKQGGVLLSTYRKDGAYPSLPQNCQYDLPQSHLWHIIRFMPELYSGLDGYNNGRTSSSVASVPAWAPQGQYTTLRSSFLRSVDDFFEDYYLKHNENVGEFIFNLDYAEKYQTAYQKEGESVMTYGDMKFCHGRRTSYVKQWLETRFNFLDSVMNLGHKLQMCNSNAKGGPEYLRNNQESADRFFYENNPKITSLESALIAKNPVYITETSNKIGKTTNTNISSYSFNITTNENVMLIISLTNIKYHCFIRKNVPTLFKLTGFVANSPGLSFNVNATAAISKWEGFKALNIYNFNSAGEGAYWNLIDFDLSPDKELGVLGNSLQSANSLNIATMNELRDLNLSGISSGSGYIDNIDLSGLLKLQTLDISNSTIQSISFPSGGNLKSLNMRNCASFTGELKLKNLGSLEGTLDLSGCKRITGINISNCPKLSEIIFGENISLKNIEIADCPGLKTFRYSGGSIKADGDATELSLVEKISITGNCSGIKSCEIQNVYTEDFEMNLTGLKNLQNLTLSNISSTKRPILPEYYVYSETDLVKVDYPIYNSESNVTISLSDVQFNGFEYGTDKTRSLISYVDGGEHPTFELGEINGKIVLNLAVFPKIGALSLSKCPNIRYVACNPNTTVYSMNLVNMSSLERMFGVYPLFYNGALFGYKSLNNFRICDWTGTASNLEIKKKFEEVIDDSTKMSEFEELMNDKYEGQIDVQGAYPYTRLIVPTSTTTLENAFNGTRVSMNDVYYIMLLINLFNKSKEQIVNLSKMFQGCSEIRTSYSDGNDLSPSHYLFKYLYTAKTITNIFGGCSGMQGVLYSPDYTIGDSGILTDDKIGTLTPFVLSLDSFDNIGWGLEKYDNYTYWTPNGTPTYYDETVNYSGICPKIQTIRGILNNVGCIECAIYDNLDVTSAYFDASKLVQSFKNAETIRSSFNDIPVSYRESIIHKDGYTYSNLLKGMTKLKTIYDSFNHRLNQNAVVVDIFAGNPYSLQNEPNDYPNNITNIEGSFNFRCSDKYAYFVLTDDMFQRIKNTLEVVSPIFKEHFGESEIYQIDNGINGTFVGINIVKTYVKYNSEGTSDDALFPYGVFRGCSALKQVPGFFGDLDLNYYIDARNKSEMIRGVDFDGFENVEKFSVEIGQNEYKKDVTIPDYFASEPYTRVRTVDGTVEHDAELKLFKDTENLENISAMFVRMRPVRMSFVSNGTTRFIPGSFKLTPNAFENLKKLKFVQYLFANNHYFTGIIPYGLLNTGKEIKRTKVEGSNNLADLNKGMVGCNITETDFVKLRTTYTPTRGTGGLVSLINQVYDGFIYVPDSFEYNEPYVVKTKVVLNEDSSEIHPDVKVYDGKSFAQFRLANLNSDVDRNAPRYRKVALSDIEWYKTFDSKDETVSLQSQNIDIEVNSKNIINMSYMFTRNDAAGYLPLRYTSYYNDYTHLYTRDIQVTDTDYERRSELYKWNSYCADDFIHTNDSSYANENMLVANKLYSPYKLVSNDSRNVNLTTSYENLVDENGNKVVFANYEYDPRYMVLNENTNKISLNKFVMDGRWLSDSDIDELKNEFGSVIKNSDEEMQSASLNEYKENIIPEKWLNKQMVTHTPDKNNPSQKSGIYYASDSFESEKNIFDTSVSAIDGNEISKIIKLKDNMNYFCPSDIFNYVVDDGNVTYAFARTSLVQPKSNPRKYRDIVYNSNDKLFLELLDANKDGATTGVDNNVAYYLEGIPYTGLTGRVSPMMFEDLNVNSIEGVFLGNSQLLPFSYSSYDGGVYKNGILFDTDTFKPLKRLKDTYLLWANNIVPKQVSIDAMTFRNNKNLQYLDSMFNGTMWMNTDEDSSLYGTQIPNGMFKNLTGIKSARGTFSSVMNYRFVKDESATISYVTALGDPTSVGEFGEYTDANLTIGKYGVQWVPDDLFEDSSATLGMVSNMFYFDQNLKNFPNIYRYPNFVKNPSKLGEWTNRLYHTAYYLNDRRIEESDVYAMGKTGVWELETPTATNDKGNKVAFFYGSYLSQLN